MAISDVEKMVAVGLIWGATNAFMRRGALIWDAKSKLLQSSSNGPSSSSITSRVSLALRSFLHLILTWQYSLPLALNLSASASFFAVLGGDAPISLAVPVTNATTFAATAVAGMLLGEETRVGRALLGLVLKLAILSALLYVKLVILQPPSLEHPKLDINTTSVVLNIALPP